MAPQASIVELNQCSVDLRSGYVTWKDGRPRTRLQRASRDLLTNFVERENQVVTDSELRQWLHGPHSKISLGDSDRLRKPVNRLRKAVGESDNELEPLGLTSCFEHFGNQTYLFKAIKVLWLSTAPKALTVDPSSPVYPMAQKDNTVHLWITNEKMNLRRTLECCLDDQVTLLVDRLLRACSLPTSEGSGRCWVNFEYHLLYEDKVLPEDKRLRDLNIAAGGVIRLHWRSVTITPWGSFDGDWQMNGMTETIQEEIRVQASKKISEQWDQALSIDAILSIA